MLNIKHLTKTYGSKKAVDDLSLHIAPGEIYGFIGHNGAGKTTTLKSCVGILQFDAGEILVNGTSVRKDPLTCKKLIAYIPDNPDMYEFMTGIKYLNFIADIFGIGAEERVQRINKYADMFELTTFLNIPANAVGMAALTVVGQCLGAGEKEQAVYYSRRLMLTAYCGAWVMNLSAFFFANRFAVSLFNLSPEAQAMALDIMVWFNIVSLFVWPSSFTLPNILRAAGDARFTMTVSIVSMWAFRVGFCYLAVLCFGGGLLSIWMGMYLDWVFRSLCFYLRFRRGSWLEQSVI